MRHRRRSTCAVRQSKTNLSFALNSLGFFLQIPNKFDLNWIIIIILLSNDKWIVNTCGSLHLLMLPLPLLPMGTFDPRQSHSKSVWISSSIWSIIILFRWILSAIHRLICIDWMNSRFRLTIFANLIIGIYSDRSRDVDDCINCHK